MSIMFTKNFFIKLHHFDAGDNESFFLKAINDLSDESTLDSGRL